MSLIGHFHYFYNFKHVEKGILSNDRFIQIFPTSKAINKFDKALNETFYDLSKKIKKISLKLRFHLELKKWVLIR